MDIAPDEAKMDVEESNENVLQQDEAKNIDWKRRTLELEEQLFLLRERVNSQTSKIRDAVSKRIKDAEDQAKEAEERADDLLRQMQEYEERTLFAENKVTRCYERNQHLEDIIEQKESIIRQLRLTVSEQQNNYDSDVRAVEEKVAKVKEWVRKIREETQKEMADLQLQIQQKDELIKRLKNGFTNNSSNSDEDFFSERRERSKSAISISRGVMQVSEVVPAVPPRRASLGILNRTNSKIVGAKPTLRTLRESMKSPSRSSEPDVCVKKDEINGDLSDNEEDNENKCYKSLHHEPEEVSLSNSNSEISCDSDVNVKGVVKMTMRERLKQLAQSNEDITHTDSDSEQTVTVKLTSDGEELTVESQPKCTLTVTPGTDALGYTKLLHRDERKDSDEDDVQHSTSNMENNEESSSNLSASNQSNVTSPATASKFKSYLPQDYVLYPNKMDTDSGCSSLEHIAPNMVHEYRILNPLVNGVIASEEWKRSCDLDTIHGTSEGFNYNTMQVQTCPVYAQLEGRASEIQSGPCTGDSTDSSDNETSEPANTADGEPAAVGRAKSVSVGDRLLRRGSGRKKVLKTCAQYTTQNLKTEALQKAGYLLKLGGRVKNWKRRWFVLSENKLSYYKTESDANKKALGQIPLDGFCGITRTEGSLSFQIDTAKRRYYLTGESVQDIDDWLKVLQNVLRKFMASPLLAQVSEKAVMKGWITKVKLGQAKRCYCILRGKYLCYYKGEDDQAPFGVLNMKEVQIEKISGADSEEDLDNDDREQHRSRFTLRLFNEKQPSSSCIYLTVDNKQDHNAWLYHLTMASGHIDKTGTEFERTIAKLKEENGDPDSSLWNGAIMTHSKDPLDNPLTTLPSEELENKALQLFKSIQLFCNAECLPAPAIDYHVVYAQNALQMCMTHVELREEIYCQLMKQTAKRVHVLSESADALERFLAPHSEWLTASRTYSTASDATIDLRPVREYVYEQCWQLLVLCCSLFVPRGQVLWFLKAHLQRYSTKESIIGKYAKYCQYCLDRTIQNGERESGPSRMEVIAVLTDDPFEHKYPLKIPVHFINRTSEDFGFDGATTVQELVESINSEVGLRSTEQSGYALYTDNPVGPVQHCLQTSVKVCDVIAKWEKAMQSSHQGKYEPSRIIKLTYKNRLYFKSLSKSETARERYFLVYQTFDDILHGRFPFTKDRCMKMAALMAQMEFGDRVKQDNQHEEKILMIQEKFYPRKLYKEAMTSELRRQVKNRFLDAWQSLMGKSKQECITLYLRMAKGWAPFGAKLFKAKQRRIVTKRRDSTSESVEDIWLAVEEDCISILDTAKMNPVFKYKYRSVVTFGGWKEDFMLVVNKTTQKGSGQSELGTERLLFVMPRGKILEITLLVASFINAIVRQQGLTFDVACPTKKTTGASEKKIKVWDMESAEWPMVPGAGLI